MFLLQESFYVWWGDAAQILLWLLLNMDCIAF